MSLFELKKFTSHFGEELSWKIDCDSLTLSDLRALATLVREYSRPLISRKIVGIGRGGSHFAAALEDLNKESLNAVRSGVLIVDDVLTTGKSMNEERGRCVQMGIDSGSIHGIVIFSRAKKVPDWIMPIFQLNNSFITDK